MVCEIPKPEIQEEQKASAQAEAEVHRGKGNSFWPSRGSINYGEDVGLALGGRKRANNINVVLGKWELEEGTHGHGFLDF